MQHSTIKQNAKDSGAIYPMWRRKIKQSKIFIPRKTIKNKYEIKTLSDKQK